LKKRNFPFAQLNKEQLLLIERLKDMPSTIMISNNIGAGKTQTTCIELLNKMML
jgi:hypothetical protein